MLDFPSDKEILSYCNSLPWLFNTKLLNTAKIEYILNPDNTINLMIVYDGLDFLFTYGMKPAKNNPLLPKIDIHITIDEKNRMYKPTCMFTIYNLKNFAEYITVIGLISMNKQYFIL